VRRLLTSPLLLVVLTMPAFAQQTPQQTVPESPKGFDQQYQEVFKAYKKDDAQGMKSSLDEFSMPLHWFTDVFGPDLGEALAKQYAEQFQSFESSTTNRLQNVDRKTAGSLETKRRQNSDAPRRPQNQHQFRYRLCPQDKILKYALRQ